MTTLYYIGLDIHKKVIAYCIKALDGRLVDAGMISAHRNSLDRWVHGLPGPWVGALEATIFSGWIYDYLSPHAVTLKVAHPEMLKAITAAKKKNDLSDAEKIADLLRVDLLPQCYMLPEEIRELRRILRYRNHIVRTGVQMQNKMCGLLMEVGADYNKRRLRGKKYFKNLLATVEDIPQSVKELLQFSRSGIEMFTAIQKQLVEALRTNELIRDRVQRLITIQGVGQITALTWVLEVGDPARFRSIRKAISYCGLCSTQQESAGKERRGPISKKRNKHLQTMLVEAAKIAPHWNPRLASIYEKEVLKGNRNRATLAVARKLVAYLLAVDRAATDFVCQAEQTIA